MSNKGEEDKEGYRKLQKCNFMNLPKLFNTRSNSSRKPNGFSIIQGQFPNKEPCNWKKKSNNLVTINREH